MKGHRPLDVLLGVPGQISEPDHSFPFKVISRDKIVIKDSEDKHSIADLVLWDDTEDSIITAMDTWNEN